jgi:hypothetical protein
MCWTLPKSASLTYVLLCVVINVSPTTTYDRTIGSKKTLQDMNFLFLKEFLMEIVHTSCYLLVGPDSLTLHFES